MQGMSKSSERWKELAATLKNEDHYLAKVLTARLLKSGELGGVDISKAITLAKEADNARSSEHQERNWKMSSRNYQTTSGQTLYEIVVSNPTNPQSRYLAQFVQGYQKAQKMTEPLPEVRAQLEPGLIDIEKASRGAAEKAEQMLVGVKKAGNIQAQKVSLDSALRNRISDSSSINADQRTMATLAKELETVEKLDQAQSLLLEQSLRLSHLSGDRAISMMPTMMNVMMNIATQRGMEYIPTLIPYSKKLQSYSDAACTVISRLDHTVMVKKLATTEPERNGLANMMAQQ
jgi:hypothetical protein